MAINTADWSHYLAIPESYIPSSATSGQTLVITDSVIAKLSAGDQSTFWSNVENGGGDIRIYIDDGGVNQLPVEVVSLDSVAETCVIWTLKSTYDGTGNLYVFIGNSGATQPAVNDTFGRNAVWANEINVYHGGSIVDSAGNNDLTNNNVTLGTAGKIGEAFSFDGSTSYLEAAGHYPVTGDNARSVRLWAATTETSNRTIVSWGYGFGSSGARWEFRIDNTGGLLRTEVNGGFVTTSDSISGGDWKHVVQTLPGGDVTDTKHYVDGTLSSVSSSSTQAIGTDQDQPLRIGARAFASLDYVWSGQMESIVISGRDLTPAFIATEYANQSDPASFYGTPTITAISTPTVTADVDFSIPAPVFSASASATLPQPNADVSFSIPAPSFSVDASVTLPEPSASVDFTIAAPVFSASATATLPQPSAEVSLSIPAPIFSVSIFVGTVGIILNDDTNITLPALSTNVTLPVLSSNINL